MSVRQVLLGFHRQLLRLREANAIRRPIAQLAGHPAPVQHARNAVLRFHRPSEAAQVKNSGTFQRTVHDLIRGFFLLAPSVFQHAHVMATYARRFATIIPGRTVAPLLGFIAAFLQESKTEEFKANVACVAVRDEVAEFSKSSLNSQPQMDLSGFRKISDLEFGSPLGRGCNAAVYEARVRRAREAAKYDLAVKVLFNYSKHSDAEDVSRLFENELLPSRLSHQNIIDVFQALVDEVPQLPDCEKLFPDALPQRLNPNGAGRNQTMFVLMNKFSCTLRDDLLKRGAYELTEGLSVFGQLLEGVAKLVKENIVHRDIKSDNILVLKSEDGKVARAVISDFGCSLDFLRMNYTSSHISKGGNTALMPPEVINAEPGLFSVIDYSRADLWSVGTMAYEIFTGYNPFFEGVFKLSSRNYEEERLPEVIPGHDYLNNLVCGILRRDPTERPAPAVAATACHMLLWDFPMEDTPPSVDTVRLWIMQLCVKLICGSRNGTEHRSLLATFLKRCNVTEVLEAWKLLSCP